MTQFFQNYFHFALEATIVLLIVLALRPIFKRYSKRVGSLLWIVVFFRLLCPVTIEGPVPAFWNGWFTEGESTRDGFEKLSEGTKESWKDQARQDASPDLLSQQNLQNERETGEVYPEGQDATGGEGKNVYEWLEENRVARDGQEELQTAWDVRAEDDQMQPTTPVDGQENQEALPVTVDEKQNPEAWSKVASLAGTETADLTREAKQEINEAATSLRETGAEGGNVLTDRAEKVSAKSFFLAVRAWFQGVAGRSFTNACGVIWIFGMGAFLIYGAWAYVKLYRKLREAVPAGEWRKYSVKISDASGVPMSFGVLRPEIYVPASFQEDAQLTGKLDAKEREMILHHEATHLRRRDPLWKLISFLALASHWWNPLVWLSIRLFHKDLEMACDEGVLEQIGWENRKEYAKALLHFAEKKSGLSMAAAFGESDAESRIKATLKFKKRPVWLSITLSCLVLLLGGCLATSPREESQEIPSDADAGPSGETARREQEEDKQYGAESVTEDGYYVYASGEALQEGFQERFRDILLRDGKINEDDLFIASTSKDYVEKQLPAKRDGEHLSSIPSAVSVSEEGELTQFLAILDYYKDGEKYYLGEVTIYDNKEVTTLDQARMFFPLASHLYRTPTQADNVPTLFLDHVGDGFYDLVASTWKEKDSGRYAKLSDPVSAVTELMHLKGGKGEASQCVDNLMRVTYVFADGEEANYYAKKRGATWIPYSLSEYFWFLSERYPEEYGLHEKEALKSETNTEQLLRTASATQLRSASHNAAYSTDLCWEGGKEGDFAILDEIPERDAALYGLYGDGGMVLRVGEKTYPIWMNWASNYHLPELYAGDYDGDGDVEYALVVMRGTGTGVSKEGLYVLELRENEAESHGFEEYVRYEELAKRLTYEYNKNEKNLTLAIDQDGDGTKRYVSLFLEGRVPEEDWLASPVGIGFGDQESMEPVDDNLYYELTGGLLFNGEGAPAMPWYEASVKLICRVQYHADGTFTISGISGKEEYYNAGGAIDHDLVDPSLGEEIISKEYADLTRDGINDVIVTSVTYHEENKDQSWKQRMEQYETCLVRVYDGANVENVIWESQLADAHTGNGMILLCKRDGKDYLLTGSSTMFQWVQVAEYRVFSVGEYGTVYEVESGNSSVEVATPEDVMDVEAMVAYVKRLDAWTKDARLLALTDVEFDDRIGGKYDAAETWKYLYLTVEEMKSALQYGSDKLIDVPAIVPLKGMTNLEESLTSLNACWRACAELIVYGDTMHQILTDLQPGKNVYTCHLTHGRTPDTVTVDYKAALDHAGDPVLIEVKNNGGKTIWNGEVTVSDATWATYYLTIYEEQAYLIDYRPVHEADGVSQGYFKMFYLDEEGREQVICECSVNSSTSKNFEKDRAVFEETQEAHMGKMNLIVGVMDGKIAIKQVQE